MMNKNIHNGHSSLTRTVIRTYTTSIYTHHKQSRRVELHLVQYGTNKSSFNKSVKE